MVYSGDRLCGPKQAAESPYSPSWRSTINDFKTLAVLELTWPKLVKHRALSPSEMFFSAPTLG